MSAGSRGVATAGRRLAVAAALVLALALPAAAHATTGVGSHGPVTEAYGWFPEWYEDAAGLRLALCVDGPYCMATMEAPLPDPDKPASFPDNFPEEAFWWGAESTLTYPGGSALLVLGQEAAFANGPIAAGEQVAFGRVRIRATGLIAGAWYRFTFPYGQLDLQAIDKATRVVNYTSDIGCLAPPCDNDAFSQLGGSAIGPEFLQWDTTQSAPPEGYIGNPAISHRVTGSRFVPEGETEPANHFRIDRITARGGTVLSAVGRTDYFMLQGKLAGPARGRFAAARVRFADRQVGTSAEEAVTLRNTGSAALTLGAPALAGDDAGDFRLAGGTCSLPGALAPGQTCTVRVGFTPAAAGARSARLEVPETRAEGDDDSGPSATGAAVHSVALSGTATAPPAPAGPASTAPAPAGPAPARATATLVPVAGPTVLGITARSQRAAVRGLTVPRVLARARVRAEGVRLVLRIGGDANVVRLRIRRMRGTTAGPVVAQAFRSPTGNPVRLRLAGADLRRRLAPGRYRVEVAAGMSRATLGAAATATFRVVR